MESLERILSIIAWPVTVVIIVLLLRSSISKLIPSLSKLKYKDLELEFEREANKILAEAERDLPEPPATTKPAKIQESDMRYSLRHVDPLMQIMESWRDLELKLRSMLDEDSSYSIRAIINQLCSLGEISQETSSIILDLAALRNRVAHAKEEAITYEAASAYNDSVRRVMAAMNSGKAQQI
ncbi:hypothetical protein N5E30_20380 [Pseudomonas chengduensis]|nr:hypothetical protein [Pseudomonas chengduensis]MDH0624067.1 hypothetical protein [Pseudomonas chengduensis]MDH1664877.1 hypothetical protein [Pseudomonas chengduensis]MDH1683910.1 hypothetical protein [Pseudomonas chengduensis]